MSCPNVLRRRSCDTIFTGVLSEQSLLADHGDFSIVGLISRQRRQLAYVLLHIPGAKAAHALLHIHMYIFVTSHAANFICLQVQNLAIFSNSLQLVDLTLTQQCSIMSICMQKLYQSHGGMILDNHRVTEVIPGDPITVVTEKGTFRTQTLVITAGD